MVPEWRWHASGHARFQIQHQQTVAPSESLSPSEICEQIRVKRESIDSNNAPNDFVYNNTVKEIEILQAKNRELQLSSAEKDKQLHLYQKQVDTLKHTLSKADKINKEQARTIESLKQSLKESLKESLEQSLERYLTRRDLA